MTMIRKEISRHLVETIIPYWRKLRDEEHGGYYGYVDFDLKIQQEAVKGSILNSRILWFFSSAFEALGDHQLLDDARHAYRFLTENFIDREYGGVYWAVTADGLIKDPSKHTYSQAFAVYALCAYYEASKETAALTLAMELFQKIEENGVDEYGYLEAFSRDWQPETNEKLSENGLMADKTMNTLLHVLEAYTELYRQTGAMEVKVRIVKILSCFKDKVYSREKRQLEVFFDKRMDSISDLYSYGHDIEASWLIDRACEVLEIPVISDEIMVMTADLGAAVYERALVKGAVNNECFKEIVDKTKIWWVQAEAMVGFCNMYQRTNEQKYLTAVNDIWDYVKKNMIDPREGSEWYWDINEDGIPKSRKPITEPWKCPYHNGRMCLEIMRRMR